MRARHRPPKGRVQVKTEKPKGKDKSREDTLRMPADEFDRIMRKTFQGATPEPLGTDKATPANRPDDSKK